MGLQGNNAYALCKKVFLSEFVIVWLTSRDVGLQPKKIILCVLNFNEMMTELSLKFMRC